MLFHDFIPVLLIVVRPKIGTYRVPIKEIRLLFRVLGLVAVIVAVIALMSTTNTGKFVLSFIIESKQEVRKVIWPTRDETMRTTLLVFAMVFIVGLLLWVLDMFLFWGVRLLTGQG